MILSGELKDFSLADVLQLLLQQRKSGVLNLSNTKEKAELFISGGNVNGVKVNGEMPEDKIKEMLVASGKVDKNGIQELESISNEMNRPLLTTLVAKGYLTEEDKKEWLQIISEDMICELFGWTSGRYEFGTSLKAQASLSIHLNISTEFACMEGMRRIDEWPRLKESLPNFRIVFRPEGKTYDGDALGWDFLVLGLVDGRKNVSQISKQVPFGSFRLSECLVNLWQGGFIAPATESLDELEILATVDPQSEKDRKTAMVLGVALLFLVFATMIRLVSFWMLGSGSQLDAKNPNSGGFEAGISQNMLRENLSTLLIGFAAKHDMLPTDLHQIQEDGAFTSHELNMAMRDKSTYKKTSERSYQLK
jgi:hypothetical protein